MDILSFFHNLTNILWGNFGFQTLFYFSLILILIFEKKSFHKKIILGYSICVLLIIYNPLMYQICKFIFGTNDLTAYYCRLFCLIPIIFLISYAMVLILHNLQRKKKLCYTLLMLVVIVMSGHSVYSEKWFTKAENFNKVPIDVLQLCNLFPNNGQISIMVPTDLTAYMRQINSNFSMPYGRNENMDISNQLQSEAPDVKMILNYAQNTNTDYIVIIYNENILSQCLSLNCEIIGYTDHYIVLKYPGS